jgi:hypothetical protein
MRCSLTNRRWLPRVLGAAAAVEVLEPRVFLTGVTLITHGYEPLSSDRPAWLDQMKDAIVAVRGWQTSVYALRIAKLSNGSAGVVSFDWLSGVAPAASNKADVVIMLDWADASGLVLSYYSTTGLAGLVPYYFLNSFPSLGITRPLAELPIHLIGHSRGASLVSALANKLGTNGLWVDQVTTLDPYLVSSDAALASWANVVFADNYYQTSDIVHGSSVVGAANTNLTSLNLGHSGIRDHYLDTILGVSAPGYGYSAGASRPAGGVGTPFGGTGQRSSVTRSGSQWPNLANVTASPASLDRGRSLSVSYRFADPDSTMTVQWFLDKDWNPYNDNAVMLGSAQSWASAVDPQRPTAPVSLSVPRVTPGQYTLLGRASDAAGHQRFVYSTQRITVTSPRADKYEPNDTLQGAWKLGTLTGATTIPKLNMADDQVDFYRFALKKTGTAGGSAFIDFANSQGNLDLYLLSTAGVVLNKSVTTGNRESVSLSGLKRGTYVLKVQQRDNLVNLAYTLTIQPVGPTTPAAARGTTAAGSAIPGRAAFSTVLIDRASPSDELVGANAALLL